MTRSLIRRLFRSAATVALGTTTLLGAGPGAPSAHAAAAAPQVSLRFLMIVKPVSQVPNLSATLSPAQVDAASTAFLSTFPRMVEDLTNGTVDMNTQVVISPRPLTSIGYAGLMVEPGNIPEDVAEFVHPEEWDGVFVYNAFRPHAYFSSGAPGPYNTGWSSVNARDDLGYHQDALAGWVHEMLHQLGEQYYFQQRGVPGAVDLHSAADHGYTQNQYGLPYWIGWYRDFLNGTIPGNLGLGAKAWTLGNRRGVPGLPVQPDRMIAGAGSGRCVDVSGGRSADGTRVQLWDCHGGPEVRWRWRGNTLVNTATSKCLDVSGGRTAGGTVVQLWTCLGNGAQQWLAVDGALRNPQSGKCLDADGWGTVNGTRLIIWECGSRQSNQTWSFR
ncbi:MULTISPECIES: RICIN domain-containing protein [unclassified Micromonospora]|uniref:RICIN domain-containing protein n=1 Tax=unclassified Micromonospora TaxID=2617518 RepID=UPI0020B2B55E|nr:MULTISPECIES: RICIN domain-containing protein [unclassified Micromonospora]MDM4781394.1 RICIN domain-containing protein [Micromonospora sp. b486]